MRYVGWALNILYPLLALIPALAGCGKAIPIIPEGEIGDARIADGGTRTDGPDGGSFGGLRSVTLIFPASGSGSIPGWTYAAGGGHYPFVGPLKSFGTDYSNGQAPFYFSYSYPPNNFALSTAQLLVDTARTQDTSDSEGIFVDGVFTGYPSNGELNQSSSKVTDKLHASLGGSSKNTTFVDFAIQHYTPGTRNTFDLRIKDLVNFGSVNEEQTVSDGSVSVVLGDDSPAYQAYLVIKGITISAEDLTCSDSPTYTFENLHLHRDGNSIGSPAFTGTVETPFQSVSSAVAGFKSIEWHYDASLPGVEPTTVALTNGEIDLTVTRNADPVAIVVNGVGVAQAGFDKTKATSVVESWDDSSAATTYLGTFVSAINTNGVTAATTSLNLVSLLGQTKLLTLMFQGRLNVAFAGGFRSVTAAGATASRTKGTPISGPQLDIDGTYHVSVCEVPDDPDSVLSGGDGGGGSTTEDGSSPYVSSLTATNITSTGADIAWLTNEPATSLVQTSFDLTNFTAATSEDTSLSLFHSMTLTGLQPYKFYYYRVVTRDGAGNTTTSSTKSFRTLR
jgi:hypothetical protein